jgi:hypothetical protein
LVFAAVALSFSSLAFSQGRTIEETLVVSDPTVAAAGKWKVGGAAEYWYVNASYKLVDDQGRESGSSHLNFTQPGWNIYGAYGNLTFAATGRKGDGNYTATQNRTGGGSFNYEGPHESKDEEYTLRWLFPTRNISPYLIVGYAKTVLTETLTITSSTPAPTTWLCGQGTLLRQEVTYKGPLFGGGGIIPFSEKFGARVDLRLKWNDGSTVTNASAANKSQCDKSGSGLGYDFTATGYWNIVAGLNAQIGLKYQYLHAGSDVRYWNRYGLFGMLGYTFQF